MFFKKKTALPSISLYLEGNALYEGYLKDLPLREDIIIEKSIQFFSDPEPCHIHRSAVALRLTEELFKLRGDPPQLLKQLSQYSSFSRIDRFVLVLSEHQKIDCKA